MCISFADSFLGSLPVRKRQQHWQTSPPPSVRVWHCAHTPHCDRLQCPGQARATCHVALAPRRASAAQRAAGRKRVLTPKRVYIAGDRARRGWGDAVHVTGLERSVFKALLPNLLAIKDKLTIISSHVNSFQL